MDEKIFKIRNQYDLKLLLKHLISLEEELEYILEMIVLNDDYNSISTPPYPYYLRKTRLKF